MSDVPSTSSDALERRPAPPLAIGQLVMVAAAYLLLAVTVMHLALGPDRLLAIFPSAGLALAATLVYGRRALWAVAAGSLGFQWYLYATTGHHGSHSITLALAIPLGAVAQAAFGAWLIERAPTRALTLDGPKAIGRVFALGGAVACAVSASWATALSALMGSVSGASVLTAWLAWWAADTLGVVIGVPAVLTLIGRPRRAWRPRRFTVGLPLAAATLLLVLAAGQVGRTEAQRRQANFERIAQDLSNTAGLRLQAKLFALEALHSVFVASRDVSALEFEHASRSWLSKLAGLQAVGWHERVPRESLAAFEADVRVQPEPEFRVFERDPALTLKDADALVMRYVQPRAGNETALGVNILSIAEVRTAVEQVRRTDAAVATSGFRLTQETGGQTGVVVYRAVRTDSGEPVPTGTLRGLVFLSLRMDEALVAITQGAPSYLETCLRDVLPNGQAVRLAGPPGCDRAAATPLQRRVTLPFAGRTWEIDVRAPGGLPAAASGVIGGDGSTAWLFSVTGLIAIGVMGALLLLVTGRERLTQAAVDQRTVQLQHEINERQLTERALRESEGRFRSIFKTVPVGMVYTDLNGRIKQANSALCTLTGYSEEELLSLSMATLTHEEDRELDDQRRRDLIAGRRPLHRLRMRYVARNGDVRWVRSTVTVLRDAHGAPHRLVALVEDISEHLRLEEAEKARESAENANRAKNDFLSRMSHELRTPLNAMLGFAQLLDMDRTAPLHERHRLWVAQIQQAGWHLLEMINDVLDLSRIESGTLNLVVEPLPVEPLISASLTLVEPQARARGITLTRVMAEHGPLRLMGDATRVKQILTNLLSNAIKYNRDGGEVRISTREVTAADGSLQLALDIVDTGVGIDADQISQLFQPFNRLGRERGSTEGTGIGLVIAKLLAERQGGALAVKSEAQVGSTFTLLLPLDPNEAAIASERAALVTDSALYNRRHVLYIEDNETNVEVMRGIFNLRPQVKLSIATTGLDGMAAVRTLQPDLVLLDMHLPDIDGMALLDHLKADPTTEDVPVVVVSADALPAQIETALRAGAARYLTKPVAIDEMLGVLDEQLTKLSTRFG